MSDTRASASLAPPSTFSQPWQLRAYVIATALVEREVVDRDALDAGEGEAALRSWLSAVECSLLDQGQISTEELEAEIGRQAEIAASRKVH